MLLDFVSDAGTAFCSRLFIALEFSLFLGAPYPAVETPAILAP